MNNLFNHFNLTLKFLLIKNKGFFGTIIGYISVYGYDYKKVTEDGFFQGYNSVVWTVILLQVNL